MSLTEKQKAFVDAYIKSANATEAAREAGYSAKTVRSIGAENLTKPDIKKYIKQRMDEIASDRIMGATEAVELLSRIARGEETETVFVPLIDGSVSEQEKSADLKTKIVATKEILKRYPAGNDLVAEQQIRKLKAEADITEFKRDVLTGAGDNTEKTVLLDDINDLGDEGNGNSS
ncbi:terminase small subunit [Loigolactobacillus backii]|uniref:terminase small subunit n=1 Tax=Loigolactobacillus backii TaxID=375175 RepID=UPI000C1C87F9|nr:terminase small subunit [Loigolactobacillus backii]PIO83555.1 terminase small subunit [Loigolactobacillus backii]